MTRSLEWRPFLIIFVVTTIKFIIVIMSMTTVKTMIASLITQSLCGIVFPEAIAWHQFKQ